MIEWSEKLKHMCSKNVPVSEGEIICNLPYELHSDWDIFMRGKTCPILESGDHGVYSWDLKQFLNKI
jgi:hypothetical protein